MYSPILHGKRFVEFRVSAKFVQNASAYCNSFSSAVAADVRPKDNRKKLKITVSYLTESLGLTPKLAESISKKVGFRKKGDPDSVLNLLRSYGFTESQMSSIIKDYPLLLLEDAEKFLGPKLQFLKSRGASSSELTEIVSKVPKILGRKEGKASSRYYDCVKEILEADKSFKYGKLSHSLPEGSKQENIIRNVLVLRELGIPQKKLFSLLVSHGSAVCGKEKFEESLKKVVEMGFDPTTSKFVEGLVVLYGMSDKAIDEKVNIVYKRLGFAESDVWEMFRKHPIFLTLSEKKILKSIETFQEVGFSRDEVMVMLKCCPQCLNLSADTLKKKTNFLVKKMKLPLKSVVANPQVLGFSMEKRIVPRCNVIKALISKGLLGDSGRKLPSLTSVLVCSDETFLQRYVQKYDDMELLAIFNKGRVS